VLTFKDLANQSVLLRKRTPPYQLPYNFAKAPKGDCVTTGGGDVTILGYNDVWVTMTYGKTQRRALLKRVAYCQGFNSNLISWNLLKKDGWRWNIEADVL
jgi:hypothetical protein